MSAMASQITGVSTVYSTVCSGADQRKHHSSASLAFVRAIHWWPVNPRTKGHAVTRIMCPIDDIIIIILSFLLPLSLFNLPRDVQRISSIVGDLPADVSDHERPESYHKHRPLHHARGKVLHENQTYCGLKHDVPGLAEIEGDTRSFYWPFWWWGWNITG